MKSAFSGFECAISLSLESSLNPRALRIDSHRKERLRAVLHSGYWLFFSPVSSGGGKVTGGKEGGSAGAFSPPCCGGGGCCGYP